MPAPKALRRAAPPPASARREEAARGGGAPPPPPGGAGETKGGGGGGGGGGEPFLEAHLIVGGPDARIAANEPLAREVFNFLRAFRAHIHSRRRLAPRIQAWYAG